MLLIGVAAGGGAWLTPLADQTNYEFGLLSIFTRYELALPLVGLGLAVAQAGIRHRIVNLLLFLGGIVLGTAGVGAVLSAIDGTRLLLYLLLFGPACCVGIGAVLIAPRALRIALLPAVAVATGAGLALVVDVNDPTSEGRAFAIGAILASFWLVVAPLLLWLAFERAWFRIASRILGSWLLAIGLMLGASFLLPPRALPEPEATEQPPGAPLAPGAEPSGIPEQVF